MISTATAAANARIAGAVSTATNQITKVTIASDTTTGTKIALIRSASAWIGARDALGVAHQSDDARQAPSRPPASSPGSGGRRCR